MMSTEGILFATMVISQGMPMCKPEVETRGFINRENTKISSLIKKDIEEKTKRMLRERRGPEEIEDFLKKSLKNYIYKLTRRNPIIIVKIIEV